MSCALLALPGNEALAGTLRAALDVPALTLVTRDFPDGETYLRVEGEVKGRAVAVLCTLHEPNPQFLPLAFIADALRDLGAASVGLVAPYLAYMRQDARFMPGEAITSSSFAGWCRDSSTGWRPWIRTCTAGMRCRISTPFRPWRCRRRRCSRSGCARM